MGSGLTLTPWDWCEISVNVPKLFHPGLGILIFANRTINEEGLEIRREQILQQTYGLSSKRNCQHVLMRFDVRFVSFQHRRQPLDDIGVLVGDVVSFGNIPFHMV